MEKTSIEIRFGVLIISDRSARGEREDLCAPALRTAIESRGWRVTQAGIVPDEEEEIKAKLIEWSDSGKVDVLLTSGGTGFSPRDVTPEATQQVIEKNAPGIAEAIRTASLKITPHAMLSRGVAGIRKKTLIINLPGSPKGAVEGFEVIRGVLGHAVQLLQEDKRAEAGHHVHPED